MEPKLAKQDESFSIKDFLVLASNNKFFFIITLLITLGLAYAFNRFSPTIWRVSSVIGPVEDGRSSLLESNEYFSGLGNNAQQGNLENDINSLRSFSLVNKTANKLGLEVSYFEEPTDFFNWKILSSLNKPIQNYNRNAYSIQIDKSHVQAINTNYQIQLIDKEKYRLIVSQESAPLYNYLDNQVIQVVNNIEIDTIHHFNQTLSTPFFKFSVQPNNDHLGRYNQNTSGLFFRFNHIDDITRKYLGKLNIQPVSLRSTLINVSAEGSNLNLTVDFLNSYLQEYLNENLNKKNNIAINTINFIDRQLSEISDSLVKSESKLRDFRASNKVTDLTYQGQQALAQLNEVEDEISTLKIQENYYKYILDYFNENRDIAGLALPSAANVIDPIMNSMLLELLELNAERTTILSSKAEKSLFLGQIESKIKLQKQTIIENVKNNLHTMDLTMNELNYRHKKLSQDISRLPKTELNMVSMQRQFNITDAMYTFLLQKRAEAAISMASNIPDYEILEPARHIISSTVSPRKVINYLLAIFIGLFLPAAALILKLYFNQKISSIKELERIISEPVYNFIFTNYRNAENVSSEYPNSSIAESFRNLRSNLFIKTKNYTSKVMLVTSSQPGEGKSFIAFNTAVSVASVGHKTIIIDCDFRKPKLHQKLKTENSIGLTNYMTDESSIKEIIVESEISNLHYIVAGPIHPNSSELIEARKLDKLIAHLKEQYDFVIIDTSPVGLVSDATALLRYISNILLVCRNNYTNRNMFIDTINSLKGHTNKETTVVFNDIPVKKSKYGNYAGYYHK